MSNLPLWLLLPGALIIAMAPIVILAMLTRFTGSSYNYRGHMMAVGFIGVGIFGTGWWLLKAVGVVG